MPLVNDDDASAISGVGRKSLNFLLTGKANDRTFKIQAKAGKRNVKKKLLNEMTMPTLPAATALQPQAIRKKQLEEGILVADDKDESVISWPISMIVNAR